MLMDMAVRANARPGGYSTARARDGVYRGSWGRAGHEPALATRGRSNAGSRKTANAWLNDVSAKGFHRIRRGTKQALSTFAPGSVQQKSPDGPALQRRAYWLTRDDLLRYAFPRSRRRARCSCASAADPARTTYSYQFPSLRTPPSLTARARLENQQRASRERRWARHKVHSGPTAEAMARRRPGHSPDSGRPRRGGRPPDEYDDHAVLSRGTAEGLPPFSERGPTSEPTSFDGGIGRYVRRGSRVPGAVGVHCSPVDHARLRGSVAAARDPAIVWCRHTGFRHGARERRERADIAWHDALRCGGAQLCSRATHRPG
jgi:hypothetical protein